MPDSIDEPVEGPSEGMDDKGKEKVLEDNQEDIGSLISSKSELVQEVNTLMAQLSGSPSPPSIEAQEAATVILKPSGVSDQSPPSDAEGKVTTWFKKITFATLSSRSNVAGNWIGVMLSASMVILVLFDTIYATIALRSKGKNNPSLEPLSDEEKAAIKAWVEIYVNMTSADLWSKMAQYIVKCQANFNTTLLMINDVIQLSPSAETNDTDWVWRTGDKATQAGVLITAFNNANGQSWDKAAAMMNVLPTITYDGYVQGSPVTLPNCVAADLALSALGSFIPNSGE